MLVPVFIFQPYGGFSFNSFNCFLLCDMYLEQTYLILIYTPLSGQRIGMRYLTFCSIYFFSFCCGVFLTLQSFHILASSTAELPPLVEFHFFITGQRQVLDMS